MEKQQQEKQDQQDIDLNKQRQGVDKAPGEEFGKGENVTQEDLKGKKIDADPEKPSDQPSR